MSLKRYFLIFAACAATAIALLNGGSPDWLRTTFLDVPDPSVDVAHILRAVMGIYLAMAVFWVYAAFDRRLTQAAVLTTALFTGGVLGGRLVSLLLDGRPSRLLLIYVAVEVGLLPVAVWVYRRPGSGEP